MVIESSKGDGMCQMNTFGRLHCPRCKSTQITPIVETSYVGGTAVHNRVTKNMGVTTYTANKIQDEYWMCHHCGNKFRNIDNLKGEIAREESRLKGINGFFYFIVAVCVVLLVCGVASKTGFLLTVSLVFAAMFFFSTFAWLNSQKKKVERLKAYCANLEKNCFD